MGSRLALSAIAFIAPQFEWPQITMSVIPSATTAYSMVAETPPGSGPKGGTMLPALRMTKSCPGSCWVTNSGTRRLSEQEINSALGFWLEARLRKRSLRCGKTSF
ncbi:hypothetical protein D3C76_1275500 [compost metagenome]